MPTNRPRRHSLSSGDESIYPHPAKADGLPTRDSARLPRSKSTSDVFDAFDRPPRVTDHDIRNIALEQADIATIRELANFLRTTSPPPNRPITHDECLKLSSSKKPKRWSLQLLQRNKRTKLQKHSSQSPLPENVTPGTTAEGHRYIAITTPVPKNSHASGPWFRSQYPVFLPRSQSSPPLRPSPGPRAWPERSSSKVVSVSSPEKGITRGDLKHSHHSTTPFTDKDSPLRPPVPERARPGALLNRISRDYLLRAMLNPVEEGFEPDLGASLKDSGFQRAPGVGQAQIQTQPLVAVHEEETDKSEVYQQSTRSNTSPPAKPSHDEMWKQSPSGSPQSRASPRPPGKTSRRPANILVQGNLAVPKENLPPESPGFPNMLANISFPSPPKGSRPSSPCSTAPSIADSQLSLGSRPIVQPRTSSRRACASTSASAASLDEIVMHERPSSRPAQSDRPTHVWTAANLDTSTVKAPSGSHSPTAPTEQLNSLEHIIPNEAGHELTNPAGSTGPSYEELGVGFCGDGQESQRESLASQLTTTTNYSRYSTPTYSSSFSSASEMSTRSGATITVPKPHSDTRQNSEHIHSLIPERCVNVEDIAFEPTAIGKDDVGIIEIVNPDFGRNHDEATRPTLRLSTMLDPNTETNPQPKNVLERRLARKAKVREYKMRDLDASRLDVVDSPVLGYFAPNLPEEPHSAAEASSAPTNGVRRSSALSMATTISEASNEPMRNTDTRTSIHSHHPVPLEEDRNQIEAAVEISSMPSVQLHISTIVATSIEPVYPTTPHWHTSGITMSPIMVVADVKSQPGSPTLRSSTLARPDSSGLRTVARLKPIMISAHSRQKSHIVTISRNPATGAIERSASGPIDPKFNRRSLMSMPTPPLSPEATQLPKKRYSLPPVQLNLSVTPRDRTSLSRSEWYSSYAEEREPEARLRSTASLKERVMREKLQKEKEITDIVEKTVGLPQKQTAYEDERDSLPSEQNNAETLEKRLRRLERTNDAWLCAMKPLLETMARTLDDMRVDDSCRSLKMSDFVIDMEAEAKRVTHSRRGEKEKTQMTSQSFNNVASGGTKIRNSAGTPRTTPLSPILQELDDSPVLDKQEAPVMSTKGGDGPGRNEALSTMAENIVGSSCTLQVPEQAIPIQDDLYKASFQATETAGSGSVGAVEESGDWLDLGPLIRELGVMPHNSQEQPEARLVGGTREGNTNVLNPLMRDLMSASRLCAEGVRGAR
ncbi:hypothetical protein F4782DRAFT_510446 [Xylaria castorea]|nr:hypothetical protein F4782DRAFT_510446 [Xylaria castorea]